MEQQNILQTFIDNTNAYQVIKSDNHLPQVIVKNSQFELETLEKFNERPNRIREKKLFHDLRGFIDYVNDFKSDTTVCFAGRNEIKVVFDYHVKDKPSWGDHQVIFEIKKSNRWVIWEKAHNQWMSQKEFANFLDSGLNEIIDPSQSEILSMVKNFRATTSYEFDSESTEYGGENITFRKSTKTGAFQKQQVKLPEYITLALEPFENLSVINSRLSEDKHIPAYQLASKLSWQAEFVKEDATGLLFKIQILNVENVINNTLETIQNAIIELTKVKVYIA